MFGPSSICGGEDRWVPPFLAYLASYLRDHLKVTSANFCQSQVIGLNLAAVFRRNGQMNGITVPNPCIALITVAAETRCL